MRFEDIEIGKRYWFWSDWHGCVMTGRVEKKIENMSPNDPRFPHRVIINQVLTVDGRSAHWGATAQTVIFDMYWIIKESGAELPKVAPELTRCSIEKTVVYKDFLRGGWG